MGKGFEDNRGSDDFGEEFGCGALGRAEDHVGGDPFTSVFLKGGGDGRIEDGRRCRRCWWRRRRQDGTRWLHPSRLADQGRWTLRARATIPGWHPVRTAAVMRHYCDSLNLLGILGVDKVHKQVGLAEFLRIVADVTGLWRHGMERRRDSSAGRTEHRRR